jgi:phosphoacetylglucosamine mutase
VKDRHAFSTEDAERKVVKPEGLQIRVDEIVAKYTRGRSFVRPSGTEDCVRVYAEAETREKADGEPLSLRGSRSSTAES